MIDEPDKASAFSSLSSRRKLPSLQGKTAGPVGPLNYMQDCRGGSQLLGAQVVREDLVLELQHESKEERVMKSANISD